MRTFNTGGRYAIVGCGDKTFAENDDDGDTISFSCIPHSIRAAVRRSLRASAGACGAARARYGTDWWRPATAITISSDDSSDATRDVRLWCGNFHRRLRRIFAGGNIIRTDVESHVPTRRSRESVLATILPVFSYHSSLTSSSATLVSFVFWYTLSESCYHYIPNQMCLCHSNAYSCISRRQCDTYTFTRI